MSALLVLGNAPKSHYYSEEFHRPVLVADIVQGLAHFQNSTFDLRNELRDQNRAVAAMAWDIVQIGRAELG
jgi:hypothetical protein